MRKFESWTLRRLNKRLNKHYFHSAWCFWCRRDVTCPYAEMLKRRIYG